MTNTEFNKMIDMAAEAYKTVYGVEKWNNLTDKQKHDAVMTIWVDFGKALGY